MQICEFDSKTVSFFGVTTRWVHLPTHKPKLKKREFYFNIKYLLVQTDLKYLFMIDIRVFDKKIIPYYFDYIKL